MNSKNNRSVRRTRAALARSLVELAAAKPVRQITVAELTERSDVSRSTFYTHYHDVFELMESVGRDLIDEADARFAQVRATHTPDPRHPEQNPMLDAICLFIDENRDAFRVLLGENGDPRFQHELAGVIGRDCLNSMGDLYGSMPRAYRASFEAFMGAGCIGLTKAWLAEEDPAPPHDMARRFGLMIKGGARALTRDGE